MSDFSDPLVPASKRSLADDVVERLRQAIWSGRLAPDERLREEMLAEFLGVSRGPIREALTRLEREGLVVKYPNRGAVVARLSPEDLDEVFSLRLAIERLAVRMAVRNAEPKHFEQMEAVIDQLAALPGDKLTEQQAAALDVAFHEILYQAAKHRRLYETWATLKPQVYIFLLTRNVGNSDFRLYTVQSHQQLLDTIRSRDAERAEAVITEHVQSAYASILQAYSARNNSSSGAN
ncbi:MAG TPA: GntR family transcriptional regulator [Phototrophicaceae bacterium]|nr:GntR family transcriptional regulator [Phototrophicaceae bacterium]